MSFATLLKSFDGRIPPFDMAGAAYRGQPLPRFVVAQESAPFGFHFKPDGTKLYVVGFGTDAAYEYDLTTAWQIATAIYTGKSVSVAAQDIVPRDIHMSADGAKMFVLGDSNNSVFEYVLSTAWDLSTAAYSGNSFSVSAQSQFPFGFTFSADGTTMYVADGSILSPYRVYQYQLSTPWSIVTAAYASKSFTTGHQLAGVVLSDAGTEMFIVDNSPSASARAIRQYTLTTPGDVSTAAPAGKSFAIGALDSSPAGLFLKPGGQTIYLSTVFLEDSVWQLEMSTPNDIATTSFAANLPGLFFVGFEADTPLSLQLSQDGLSMYALSDANDTVYQYSLATAWDVKSASYAGKSFNMNAQDTVVDDVFLSPDRTVMMMLGDTNDRVFQYSLSTPGDVNTATYTGNSFSISAQTTSWDCFFFSDDGLRMYTASAITDRVYQYSLTTAWDISTASYSGNSFPFGASGNAVYALSFSPDGQFLYALNGAASAQRVVQYSMRTPWDITTCVQVRLFDVVAQATSPRGLFVRSDGRGFYVADRGSRTVYQYEIE